ncbi:MAG: GTPase HflX [Legionellales bacterium]|nr:GTPase HflX [Legionellales bacterium]
MFERPEGGEVAVLVHIDFRQIGVQEELDEFQDLVQSAGVTPAAVITATRRAPDAKLFIGSGKVDEIRASIAASQADAVIFNHSLTPAQERNLERALQCRVLDRISLILDIFAQRARTFEGKLQVELAQLRHLSTRLVRGWTHLERQKGGIGLRGPGEKQLEVDRRLLRHRINTINRRLEKVRQQRQLGRRSRQRATIPTVSLVGYTNAGKSTLFNQITDADVFAEQQMFATLDPTLRRLVIPSFGETVFADTVGFIRHLPHELVDAFRATLEETQQADLLLHVIDAHASTRHEQAEQVDAVLAQIEANEIPQILVFNKIDLLEGAEPRVDRDSHGRVRRVWVSSLTGAGIPELLQAITHSLAEDIMHKTLRISPEQGRMRAAFYQAGAVIAERSDNEGNTFLSVRLPKHTYLKIMGGPNHD